MKVAMAYLSVYLFCLLWRRQRWHRLREKLPFPKIRSFDFCYTSIQKSHVKKVVFYTAQMSLESNLLHCFDHEWQESCLGQTFKRSIIIDQVWMSNIRNRIRMALATSFFLIVRLWAKAKWKMKLKATMNNSVQKPNEHFWFFTFSHFMNFLDNQSTTLGLITNNKGRSTLVSMDGTFKLSWKPKSHQNESSSALCSFYVLNKCSRIVFAI